MEAPKDQIDRLQIARVPIVTADRGACCVVPSADCPASDEQGRFSQARWDEAHAEDPERWDGMS